MQQKSILGHIDCPTCGGVKKMRVTSDKNGDPFGYCETGCRQQLRVGGDPIRVETFLKKHPWAAQKPVTVTEPLQEPKPAPEPVKKPVTVTEQKPVAVPVTKRKATFADALSALGVS